MKSIATDSDQFEAILSIFGWCFDTITVIWMQEGNNWELNTIAVWGCNLKNYQFSRGIAKRNGKKDSEMDNFWHFWYQFKELL